MVTSPDQNGPRPAREDRPREASLRVLRALVQHGPATLAALVAELGGHPNTTRMHLDHLLRDGFVTERALPPSGRGRPARGWVATVAGRQVALEDPRRGTEGALVEAVAEHLAAGPDPVAAAHSVGQSWGQRLAAGSGQGLYGILAAQGFAPEETPDGLALRTCPLLASALRHPDVVCGIHQGLVDAVSLEPRRLVPFAVPGACLIRPA
ncbi:helix-turn-helix transcriptional regulator [Propionicimonas sp.]|uniref:helix-turn-helix transcriptional regulator n=1 Tax=Propionicimonas sp. TaxID=1955623 RepID=UPI0039E5B45B